MPDFTQGDWVQYFRVFALNPYLSPQHYPPWILLALRPLALLPPLVGHLLLAVLSVLVVTRYLKVWWRVLLFCTSPLVMMVLLYGNVDLLLVAAFTLPVSYALVLVSCKPQVMTGWIVRQWIAEGSRWRSLVPMLVLVVVSLIAWGWWPGELAPSYLSSDGFKLPWPWTLLVGIPLLMTNRPGLWLLGSVLLSPYVQPYNVASVLAYAYKRWSPLTLVVVTAMTWVIMLGVF